MGRQRQAFYRGSAHPLDAYWLCRFKLHLQSRFWIQSNSLGSSSQIAWASSTAVVHFQTLAFQMCFFVRVMVTGSWPARRNSICMPTKPALGSSPSSMLWSSNSYASDTHHLVSLMTQDSLQVLPRLAPLNLCQHRRDGTQPRERRLPLDGLVEIKFQVTNCRQPRFTHQRSRIGSEMPSSRRGAVHRVRSARMLPFRMNSICAPAPRSLASSSSASSSGVVKSAGC